MTIARTNGSNAVPASLESTVAAARDGFACMFSTSDEYETALITQRRALGHYDHSRSSWPMVMFVGFALMIAGSVLFFA